MKFICDVMLGRLAKYLRIAGFDTAYSRSLLKTVLIQIAEDEKRIVLTRRTEAIAIKTPSSYYFVNSNYPHEQLKEVINTFNLHLDKARFFTLCLLCNSTLNGVDKSSVRGMVPDYVFTTIDDFSQCPTCKKIYWKGTHYNNMLQKLDVLGVGV
jgi:hypothetical protein